MYKNNESIGKSMDIKNIKELIHFFLIITCFHI